MVCGVQVHISCETSAVFLEGGRSSIPISRMKSGYNSLDAFSALRDILLTCISRCRQVLAAGEQVKLLGAREPTIPRVLAVFPTQRFHQPPPLHRPPHLPSQTVNPFTRGLVSGHNNSYDITYLGTQELRARKRYIPTFWGMILAEWVTEVTSLLVQTLNPYPVHVEVNKP